MSRPFALDASQACADELELGASKFLLPGRRITQPEGWIFDMSCGTRVIADAAFPAEFSPLQRPVCPIGASNTNALHKLPSLRIIFNNERARLEFRRLASAIEASRSFIRTE